MYNEIKKIYNETRTDVFVMTITYLMDVGFQRASQITDEEIADVEGNGLMTREFCQMLMEKAREIATKCEIADVYQICQAEDIFDVTFSAGKLSRDRMETLLQNAIDGLLCNDYDGEENNWEDLADYIGATEDEMEMLGWRTNNDD